MSTLISGLMHPSVPYQDKLMLMTSLELNLSVRSDEKGVEECMDKILKLLNIKNTRYIGLQLLELALQQNYNSFNKKGKWIKLTFSIIKEPHAANLEKIQACKILNMTIPYLVTEPSSDIKEELVKDVFPFLLESINENVEWAEEASNCIKRCLQHFPTELSLHEGLLLETILQQASNNISSKSFEVLAECFCELPYCCKENNADTIKDRWHIYYLRTLKTIGSLSFLLFSKVNSNAESDNKLEIDVQEFIFKDEDDSKETFSIFARYVRRFMNLCKCLAKLLSVRSRYFVKVPIQCTLKCLIPLYTPYKKEKVIHTEEELLYTFIVQMQLSGLAVVESLIKNCNLLKHTVFMKDLILVSLRSTKSIISSEPLSELRVSVWKLLRLWLIGFGRSVSKDIAKSSEIVEELLKDINIDACESLQASNAHQAHKSKKNSSSNSSGKSVHNKKNLQKTCEAALKALKALLHIGSLDFPEGIFQEICSRVFKICHTIQSSCHPFPSPYNDESCRKKLYSIVLTITIVLKPDEAHSLQTAMIILTYANNDPSFKIRSFTNQAPAIYRLQLYPKRPLPVCSVNKRKRPNVSDERLNYSEWSSEEYVENISAENVPEISENIHANVEQSFQNQTEIEIHSEEYMDVEAHYPEQIVENQCNGEDILEIQSSSHCQDDVESDEEEEEEEEERSYCEEEINQEEPQQEIYIPTSRKMQISTSVHIDSETIQSITEPEYEELIPPGRTDNSAKKSNKIKCVNGGNAVMCDEDLPSSSTQQIIANENGLFGTDDDDDSEEENEEEEEDEEESESHTTERKELCAPPLKKQKLEVKEAEEEKKENSGSPSLDQMKCDFLDLLPPEEDVRSGKIQLSAS